MWQFHLLQIDFQTSHIVNLFKKFPHPPCSSKPPPPPPVPFADAEALFAAAPPLAESAPLRSASQLRTAVAARRLGQLGLARGWSAWVEQYDMHLMHQRMLKQAADAASRPAPLPCSTTS